MTRRPLRNGPEYPKVRHTAPWCGFIYNGLRWSECPKCISREQGLYGLECLACRETYHHADVVEPCPECGSGETALVTEPDPRRTPFDP